MRCFALALVIAAVLLAQTQVSHIKAAQTAYEEGKQAQLNKEIQRAVKCFQTAIEIEPTFLASRQALIDTYLDSGQQLSGAAAITAFLEIKPDAFQYRVRLGHILLEQKQPERALAQFSLVLKDRPYEPDALLGFAASARLLGMQDRATEAIQRGRNHYPGDDRFKDSPLTSRK